MSSAHPDDDVLADLAAGQLPDPQARRVEAHVLGCPSCGDLLAGAEEVRSLLRRQPAPTMPDDVAARLAALVDPVPGTPDTPGTPARPPATPSRLPAASAAPDQTAPTRILRPVTSRRLTPMNSGARREQLSEERSDVRHDRWTSYARVAAGLVAVLVVGGGAVAGARALLAGDETGSTRSSAAEGGAGGAARDTGDLATPVLATGRRYTAGKLPQQVEKLVADSRRSATDLSAARASAGGSGSRLRSASGLDGCLRAIGRGDQRALAVDLASYADREAAVIVLQQPDGSYEVWIVARDCRAGADGTIAVRTVTP